MRAHIPSIYGDMSPALCIGLEPICDDAAQEAEDRGKDEANEVGSHIERSVNSVLQKILLSPHDQNQNLALIQLQNSSFDVRYSTVQKAIQ
jgi:hypothetical protein